MICFSFFFVYMSACLSVSFSLNLYPLSLFLSFGVYSSFSGCLSFLSPYLSSSIGLFLFYLSILVCLFLYLPTSLSIHLCLYGSLSAIVYSSVYSAVFNLPASVSRCLSVHLSLSLQLPSPLLYFFAVQFFRFLNLWS
jgi:hypothetical protein